MSHNICATGCESLEQFSDSFYKPCGILTLIISILGVVFNLLNIIVLTNVKMRTAVNLLLTILSLAELLLFTLYIPYVLLFNLMAPEDVPRYVTDNQALAYYLLFYVDASLFLHLSSIWLIITTSFFRFLLVQFPIAAVKWCTYRRAILAGVLTVSVSLLLTLPNFVQNNVGLAENGLNQSCYGSNVSMDRICYELLPNKNISKWTFSLNSWIHAIVGKFVPTILLLVFTAFLIRVLQDAEERQQRLRGESRRRSQSGGQQKKPKMSGTAKSSQHERGSDFHQTTKMLLAVVVSFTTVELPHGIFVLWAHLTDNMRVYELLADVVDLSTLSAFSINFVLYSIMSRQYRQLFVALISKPFQSKSARRDSSKQKLFRRRSSFRTMHTDHTELHPLNHGHASPQSWGSSNKLHIESKSVATV